LFTGVVVESPEALWYPPFEQADSVNAVKHANVVARKTVVFTILSLVMRPGDYMPRLDVIELSSDKSLGM
jgi:hypothetical protein